MRISDPLAQLNAERYASWSPKFTRKNAKQALLAFNGDVYEGLQASSLSAAQLDYAQSHIRILSGLYGVLRPLDLMQPYRLEMGTRLPNPAGRDLYAFWGETVTAALNQLLADHSAKVLVNLASEEYFKVVRPGAIAVSGDHAGVRRLEGRQVQDHFLLRQARARADGALRRGATHHASRSGCRRLPRKAMRLRRKARTRRQWVFRRRLES